MILNNRSAAFLSAILLLVLVPSVNADLQTGLVAYYPFDGSANDFSGAGRHGTAFNGVTYVPGMKGLAASFNGINAFIKASSDGLPTGERTVSLWLFANTIKMPRSVLLAYGGGPVCGTSWFMMLDPPPSPPFYISGHCHSYDLWAPSLQPPIGAWYHLAITTSPTGTKFFVNGQNMASDPLFVNNTSVIPGRDLTIGVDVAPDGFGPYTDVNVGYFDGLLDEVRIYNRAISSDEIFQLYQGNSNLTISTERLSAVQKGTFSSQQLQTNLGFAPFSWSILTGELPAGMTLSSSGVLSGTPTAAGAFPVTIKVTDSQNQVAQKAFTLDVLLVSPQSALRIQKTGTIAVPGRESDYFILVENTGQGNADSVRIVERPQPASTFWITGASPQPTLGFREFVVWDLPALPPSSSQVLSYKGRVPPSVPIGATLVGQATAQVVCPACATSQECFGLAAICLPGGFTTASLACDDKERACEQKCSQVCQQGGQAEYTQTTTGALDPNEKRVTAKQFIQPDQLLVYPIHFENIGAIEARDVFVTDVLDTNLDLATLTLLTGGATLDPATRTVRWSLINKNLAPGASDSVLLSIRPRPGLSSGSAIRNKATIQFEVFPPMDTNETVNIIDSTRPGCTINPLPSQTSNTTIPISWTGADLVGEIESYTVLVSQDGGTFTTFLDSVQTTSGVFQGQTGKTYGFLCVAEDTAGNIEVQNDVAEATTRIVTDTTPPVITPNISGTLGTNGWYRSNVTVTWTVTDAESGIASSTGCSSTTLSNDIAGVTLTCSAINGAGLRGSVPLSIKIDKTAPPITGLPANCTLWPPDHRLVQVATVRSADALSGLAAFNVSGTSNEPANSREDGDTAPDVVITGSALAPRVVQLRAERSGTGTGRIYTITATASDQAGNIVSANATCKVPLTQSK